MKIAADEKEYENGFCKFSIITGESPANF